MWHLLSTAPGFFYTPIGVVAKNLFSVVLYGTPSNAKNLKKQHCAYIFQYQIFTNNVMQKVITFLSPREQREREIFGGFMGWYQGHREFGKVVNPSDTRGFRARKKPVI